MSNWCTQNSLKPNSDKTNLLVFKKSQSMQSSLYVKLKNSTVKVEETAKFPGVQTDYSLKWDKHIAVFISKMDSSCAIIPRLRHCVPLENLKYFYF